MGYGIKLMDGRKCIKVIVGRKNLIYPRSGKYKL
jgi:hypothetical protein